jgi:preprotein translocase subunit SecE
MAETYKKGQGVIVRRAAFFLLLLIVVWGCHTLYYWLINLSIGQKRPFATPILGGPSVPVIDQRLDVAFVVSWALGAFIAFFIWRILNRPKSAEFLIETDAELKKVTWPSWKDAWNSSVIVLVFVALLAVVLIASDKVIGVALNLVMGVPL